MAGHLIDKLIGNPAHRAQTLFLEELVWEERKVIITTLGAGGVGQTFQRVILAHDANCLLVGAPNGAKRPELMWKSAIAAIVPMNQLGVSRRDEYVDTVPDSIDDAFATDWEGASNHERMMRRLYHARLLEEFHRSHPVPAQ
ncbi:MAG: hypothetical protein AAGA95_12240 [Pseudomonadota bacterium]